MRSILIALFVSSLAFTAAGCDPDPEEPGEDASTVALEDGEPCTVVLEDDGSPSATLESGNFVCGGDTLLYCRCDDFTDDSRCPSAEGTLVAQDLLDDCTCAEWFQGRCPVE